MIRIIVAATMVVIIATAGQWVQAAGSGQSAFKTDSMVPVNGPEIAAQSTVKVFHDALIEALRTRDEYARYTLLAEAIDESFDIETIARLAVGSFWRKMSANQKQNFTALFRQITIGDYTDNFSGYSGERFIIRSSKKITTGIVVRTFLALADGEKIQFDYLLRPSNNHWRIVDILLKGAYSELATKRGQYLSVLRNEGIGVLMQKLQLKVKPFATDDGPSITFDD